MEDWEGGRERRGFKGEWGRFEWLVGERRG
jgi:hypothetical protein